MDSSYAIVTNGTERAVGAYLPDNYGVLRTLVDGRVLIGGQDKAGWTLEDYVLPRLASGLMFGSKVSCTTAMSVLCADLRTGADIER